MVKNFEEFINVETLNEEQVLAVNEAADKLSEMLKNGETIDEGILGSILGGIGGAAIGPMIGNAICKALGITTGPLYNLLTSRTFTAAVAAYMGYRS